MATWQLWECISRESLIKLVLYQWKHYGQKLDVLIDYYKELEPIEEIESLIRQPPHEPKQVV